MRQRTVYACTTGAPRFADALLRDIQPGCIPRVTVTAVHPSEGPGGTVWAY